MSYQLEELRADLTSELYGVYTKARDEAGYDATIFAKMILEHKGDYIVKALVGKSEDSVGFTNLKNLNRLDCTIEYFLSQNKRYHKLFEPSLINRAKNRLKNAMAEASKESKAF